MSNFELVPGTPGLTLDDVAHIIVPGGGRRRDGDVLSAASLDRVHLAGSIYSQQRLDRRAGRIVCSGYKTPADSRGARWSPADASTEFFSGIPEADLMRQVLVSLGIHTDSIRVERHSLDTVTNFARAEAEGHFGDGRPVAIVSHSAHLGRIIDVVAPRTLRRAFLGVAVPESGTRTPDGIVPRLISRAILRGIDPGAPDIVARTHRRAVRVWQIVNATLRVFPVHTRYQD